MSGERIILVDKVRVNVKMKEAFLARGATAGKLYGRVRVREVPLITTDDKPLNLVETTAHSPKRSSLRMREMRRLCAKDGDICGALKSIAPSWNDGIVMQQRPRLDAMLASR